MALTHYLYVPFANNNGSCHGAVGKLPAHHQDVAERIGAEYIIACIESQMFTLTFLAEWVTPSRSVSSVKFPHRGSPGQGLFGDTQGAENLQIHHLQIT
jgi:hypothetical protein